MLTDCESSFSGKWNFSIQAQFENDETIHITDIKGDIAKRDWDHVERLIHFYEKHDFEIEIDYSIQSGELKWQN